MRQPEGHPSRACVGVSQKKKTYANDPPRTTTRLTPLEAFQASKYRPSLGRPKSFPLTSVQGGQASPVRPAHLCPHIMQNQKDKLPFFSLGHIHVTNGAQAELTAQAFTPATLLERHVSATGQTCRRATIHANCAAVPDSGRIFSSYRIAQLSAFESSPRPTREHDDSAT